MLKIDYTERANMQEVLREFAKICPTTYEKSLNEQFEWKIKQIEKNIITDDRNKFKDSLNSVLMFLCENKRLSFENIAEIVKVLPETAKDVIDDDVLNIFRKPEYNDNISVEGGFLECLYNMGRAGICSQNVQSKMLGDNFKRTQVLPRVSVTSSLIKPIIAGKKGVIKRLKVCSMSNF